MAKGEGVTPYPKGESERWYYLRPGWQGWAYDVRVPVGSTERQVQQTVRDVFGWHGNVRVLVWRAPGEPEHCDVESGGICQECVDDLI